MKQFVLVFRMDITTKKIQPSKEQMATYMQQWMGWINNIDDNRQLADGGNHFSKQGKILQPHNKITDEPYKANGQSVAYIIIYAKDMEEATSIASKCPILNGENTSLEIRETALPGW